MTPVGVKVGAMAEGWAKIQGQAPTVDGWLVGREVQSLRRKGCAPVIDRGLRWCSLSRQENRQVGKTERKCETVKRRKNKM